MADAKLTSMAAAARRPLSPHLQIYKPMLTMMMSIAHRITGAALYFGTLLIAWWLIAASSDAKAFEVVSTVFSSWFGQLVLFCYTWALFHHLLGGVRHFIWDSGHGLDDPARETLAWASLIGGLALTIIVWVISFFVR